MIAGTGTMRLITGQHNQENIMEITIGTKVPQGTIGDMPVINTVSKVLRKFDVLWSAWELDSEAWLVVYDDGSAGIVGTNHGALYARNVQNCSDKLCEYIKAFSDLQGAMHVMDFINGNETTGTDDEI